MTKPKYLVINLTNYDIGCDICGLYTKYEDAVKRLNWCVKKYGENYCNSFNIVEVGRQGIRQELEHTVEDFEEN